MARIPCLFPRQLADGRTAWNWKPSKRLRDKGWTNQRLGTTEGKQPSADIIGQALKLNEQVAHWDGALQAGDSAPSPRSYTFADLRDAYRASGDFRDLKAKTRGEYDVRLRQLASWADDGKLPIRAIDKAMVRDLSEGLAEGGASRHKVGAIMRVLRLLMNWAVAHDLLGSSPADGVKIRTAPSRDVIILPRDVQAAADEAISRGWHNLGMFFTLGLWTLQRESDLLALTRMAWRPFTNVDAADAAVLANRKGDVMGFRLRQQKTGAWIDVPVLPEFHAAIDAAFARGQHLFTDDTDPARPYPAYLLQRRGRAVLDAAGLQHAQLRDLRRSGMCLFRDYGAEDSGITTISGHAILGHRTILDTYMPKNTRTACATLATVQRARLARMASEEAK